MKSSDRAVLIILSAALLGCGESSDPTSPQLEQAVFTALGGLGVGEALTVTGPAAAEVTIGGSSTAGEFVYIPFHASNSYGTDLQIAVQGENVSRITPQSALVPGGTGSLRVSADRLQASMAHERLHAKLQTAAQPRLRASRRSAPPRAALNPRGDLRGTSATLGELVQLNAAAFGSVCGQVDNRTGRVEAITDRAIVVGDINNPANGFTSADYQSLGREFDSLVHPTVTQYFDNPTDIDENGKVIIFVTRAVNELTGPGDDGFVGGFFYARDLFPRGGADPCPASNEGEIFFTLAPDPLAQASPIAHTRDDVFNDAVSTIGHEYQHLINAGRRIYVNNAEEFEDSWLDEGLSHIAEEVLFYKAAGIGPKSNVSQANLSVPNVVQALNRFGLQNLARYGLYLEEVTRQSPTGVDNLESRGAAWSFLRYVADHTESTDEELFRSLVNSELWGIENLEDVLDTDDAAEWFRQWGVSVYTDDLVPANADTFLMQPSWNFRSLLPLIFKSFPLDVRTIGSGETVQLNIKSMSSGYVRFAGESGELSRLTTTSGGAQPPESLRVTVVRIK